MPIWIGARRTRRAASKAHEWVGVHQRAGEHKPQARLSAKQMMWKQWPTCHLSWLYQVAALSTCLAEAHKYCRKEKSPTRAMIFHIMLCSVGLCWMLYIYLCLPWQADKWDGISLLSHSRWTLHRGGLMGMRMSDNLHWYSLLVPPTSPMPAIKVNMGPWLCKTQFLRNTCAQVPMLVP